jgi:CSLREA domain-containing protein
MGNITLTSYLRASAIVLAMAAAVLLALVLMWHVSPASAAIGTTTVPGTTIKVNTIEDEANTDGDCSLREAITAADTNAAVDGCDAGSDTYRDAIHFSIGEEATITLGSELPGITDPSGLNINGRRAKITVSGNDSVRVFSVEENAKLTLAKLTVADGFAATPDPDGAGLRNDLGTVKVINSTFSGNTVVGTGQDSRGGAINNGGLLTVVNSTFSGNSAQSRGGGIANQGAILRVTNSTFSGNSSANGGGIWHTVGINGSASLGNTIVANTTQGDNCDGTITDSGYNIDDGTSCGFSSANNSKPNTDPLLDPNGLANNGGPTQTIALLGGSPAINAIPQATNGCGTEVTTDQRGVSRPQGTKCDIGAFEKQMRR